ncbi:MAG TPA: hypothetical protein VFT98_19520, partial [Myxococcota bacterium]|nr:hypothetical protein [Myxococcota bacterium]
MAIRAQRHVTRDRNRWRLAWLGMLVGSALLATGVASAADDASADPRAARIEFWNREIAVLRAEVQGHSAAARAAGVERRLADLPPVAPEWKIETAPITSGGQSGVMIVVNGAFLFAMAEQDLAEGEQLDAVVASATHRLREALEARSAQRRPAVFVRGLLISLLATGVFGALFIPIGRLRGRLLARIDAARRGDSNTGLLSNEVVRPVIVASEIAAVRSITLGVQAVLLYSWLALVFSQFPYSRPWASRLGAFLWDVLAELARGLIEAAPDLVMVAAILALARFATRIASGLLRQVETRRVELSWLDAETAKATRRLTILLIWAFAISASYPHIPGSGSDAFKGISVLVGL